MAQTVQAHVRIFGESSSKACREVREQWLSFKPSMSKLIGVSHIIKDEDQTAIWHVICMVTFLGCSVQYKFCMWYGHLILFEWYLYGIVLWYSQSLKFLRCFEVLKFESADVRVDDIFRV